MLVLTRKIGEKILIGDGIAITVVDIGRSRVKLGIEAPAGHKILREELALADATVAEPGTLRTEVATGRRCPEMAGATTVVGV